MTASKTKKKIHKQQRLERLEALARCIAADLKLAGATVVRSKDTVRVTIDAETLLAAHQDLYGADFGTVLEVLSPWHSTELERVGLVVADQRGQYWLADDLDEDLVAFVKAQEVAA